MYNGGQTSSPSFVVYDLKFLQYEEEFHQTALGVIDDPIYIYAKSSSRSDIFLSDVSPSLNLTWMDSSTTKVLVLKTLCVRCIRKAKKKIPLSTLESNLAS